LPVIAVITVLGRDSPRMGPPEAASNPKTRIAVIPVHPLYPRQKHLKLRKAAIPDTKEHPSSRHPWSGRC